MTRETSAVDVGADSGPVSNGTAANPIDLTSSPEPAHATLEPSCGGHEPSYRGHDADDGGTVWSDSFFDRRSDVRLSDLSFINRYNGKNGALTRTDYENILLLAAQYTNDELMNSTDLGNPSRNRSTGKKSRDVIKSAIYQVASHSNVEPHHVESALNRAKKASGATQRKNELARIRKHATMKKNEAEGRKYNAQNATRSAPIARPLTGLPPSGSFAFPFPVPYPSVSLWRNKDYQRLHLHTHLGSLLTSQPPQYLLDQFAANPPAKSPILGTGLIRFQPSRQAGQQSTPWLYNGQHFREFERLPAFQHPTAASQGSAITSGTATEAFGGRTGEGQTRSRSPKSVPEDIELGSSNGTDAEHGERGGNLIPNESSDDTELELIDDVDGPDASDQESSNGDGVDWEAHDEDEDNLAADDELESELLNEADGPLQQQPQCLKPNTSR